MQTVAKKNLEKYVSEKPVVAQALGGECVERGIILRSHLGSLQNKNQIPAISRRAFFVIYTFSSRLAPFKKTNALLWAFVFLFCGEKLRKFEPFY